MGIMHAFNHTGDSETKWEPGDKAQVAAATEIFNELIEKRGHTAFGKTGDKTTKLKAFDPDAETIYMVPALQGG
jgi:hypothetical protein